jgi:hypothetical protein
MTVSLSKLKKKKCPEVCHEPHYKVWHEPHDLPIPNFKQEEHKSL